MAVATSYLHSLFTSAYHNKASK